MDLGFGGMNGRKSKLKKKTRRGKDWQRNSN
jgi:hypothetical protein